MATPKNKRNLPTKQNIDSLCAMLRSIRLSGVADEIPPLLQEAAVGEWGHLELLDELFRREKSRKGQRRYENNLKISGLDECYGAEHFDFELAAAHGIGTNVARDLLKCEFLEAERNLILAGPVGTGKTFLAKTLGMEALKRGYKVIYHVTAKMVGMLMSKKDSFRFGQDYRQIRDAPLLILDDLAYLPYNDEKVEYLFSLILDRYELRSGSTIVTSNTDVTEWWKFFPTKAMGMAFSDRLLEGAQGLRFTGKSIRPTRKKKKRNAKRTAKRTASKKRT